MDKVLSISLVILLVIGLALVLTFPLMWLINWLFTPTVLVTLFGTSQITFWKTFALATVCGWLFKSSATNSK
jgi:hypothetical protein